MSRSKNVLFGLVALALIVVAIEGLAYFTGLMLSRRGLLYVPRVRAGYDDYRARRDPVLGWPPPDSFGTDGELDETGSRIIPAFASETESCVSLYGDSYTWSGEVGPEHAWSNVLSQLLNCRVANYGVSGYGTDQAYLRYRLNAADTAPVVILAHFPGDILRNVTQFRSLSTGAPRFDFKPRYVLDAGGGLEFVPIPDLSAEEYARLVRRPQDYLAHEFFVPGGLSGLHRLQFPYAWSVVRAMRHPRIGARIGGKVPYADYYRRDHPSGALALTVEIMKRFHEDVLAAGRTPILTVLPDIEELERFRREDTWTYQTLLDGLAEKRVPCLNLGSEMIERLRGRDLRELAAAKKHYNPEGYRIVAEVVFDHLEAEGLTRSGGAPAPAGAPR